MEKIKVIVFGVGENFWRNREYIENKYSVIGWSDNECKEVSELQYTYFKPEEIYESNCNKVLVTSSVYFEEIRHQLIELGISYDDIIKLHISENDNLYKKVKLDEEMFVDKGGRISGYLCKIQDRVDEAGEVPAHYFMQDILVAKKIYEINPSKHYDIGSRLDGFIAHLLVFREVEYIDIRPLRNEVNGLHFIQADATELRGIDDGTIESISCLHALEHFGLGRYGDSIDPRGCEVVASSIQRVIKKNGKLYLSVPIGIKDKVVFNAHRIFQPMTVINLFNCMKLTELYIINPSGCGFNKVNIREINNIHIEEYSCGVFVFEKS